MHTAPVASDAPSVRNVAVVRRLYEACLNRGELELLDQLIGPEYVGPVGPPGPKGFHQIATSLRGAFPDIAYTLEDVVAEGDLVVVRWRWTGTHQGPFRAFPATGKRMTNTGINVFQLRDGKIVRGSMESDRLGFLQQVGAVPPDDVLQLPPKR